MAIPLKCIKVATLLPSCAGERFTNFALDWTEDLTVREFVQFLQFAFGENLQDWNLLCTNHVQTLMYSITGTLRCCAELSHLQFTKDR